MDLDVICYIPKNVKLALYIAEERLREKGEDNFVYVTDYTTIENARRKLIEIQEKLKELE